MTVIRVKDLSLRTFIGFKPHEKKHKQDVLIQLEVEVETSMVEHNDDYQADGFYDYRSMTKSVIKLVEESRFDLLEACLLYTSPSPRDGLLSRMPSSA